MTERAAALLGKWRDVLALRVAQGFLTEADRQDIETTLDLLLEKVRAGAISEHFMQLVIEKLADEKAAAFLARQKKGKGQ